MRYLVIENKNEIKVKVSMVLIFPFEIAFSKYYITFKNYFSIEIALQIKLLI